MSTSATASPSAFFLEVRYSFCCVNAYDPGGNMNAGNFYCLYFLEMSNGGNDHLHYHFPLPKKWARFRSTIQKKAYAKFRHLMRLWPHLVSTSGNRHHPGGNARYIFPFNHNVRIWKWFRYSACVCDAKRMVTKGMCYLLYEEFRSCDSRSSKLQAWKVEQWSSKGTAERKFMLAMRELIHLLDTDLS